MEQLDPNTCATLASTDIIGEWFAFLNIQVFFQSTVTEDFGTGVNSGDELRFKTLGASGEQDLMVEGVRPHGVGNRLAPVGKEEIKWHNLTTGEIQSTSYVESLSPEDTWPDFRHIFFGDKSVLWTRHNMVMSRVKIMRAPIDGESEAVVSFELEGDQTGLVID